MTQPVDKPKPEKPVDVETPDKTGISAPDGEAADRLTPEEQMARFEKELKEQDWGHQPC